MNRDVILSLLAHDSYNRGYGQREPVAWIASTAAPD